MGNAMEAAFRDPRFPPLKHEELAGLHISVDILGPSEAAERGNLDPEVYGVIVSSGWKRGLLLPALDGVKDVDTQLSIACRKAGIAVSEPYSIRRFKVDRYSEQEN
jgi:AMMECR1 domain-containing protein